MIIVKIIGGLGNQMFQYAYAKALQLKGYEVKIDVGAFNTYKLHGGYQLDKYNIDLEVTTTVENNQFYKNSIVFKLLKKLGLYNSKIIEEKSLLFDESLLRIEDDKYIQGYFQSEKYFINLREVILKQFTMISNITNYTKQVEKSILKSHNSCSIHIRRGDFINSVNKNLHGTCDIEYYEKAIELMNNKEENINYFIFSDDIDWVKDNLKVNNAVYIDSEEKRVPHEDMYLMSLCQHNIIANSSFSWWGAWLNQNYYKIVIAPARWFVDEIFYSQSNDIIPHNWKKI